MTSPLRRRLPVKRPPSRPAGRPYRQDCVDADICFTCCADLRPTQTGTCRPTTASGSHRLPFTWPATGPDDIAPPDHLCHACGVPLGDFHHWQCPVEECPVCGAQRAYCGCYP